MVAYSFKARFAAPIVAGTKCQTIRANRKRHAHPGEAIQLYTGMRTKRCRKIIPDPICTAIVPVLIRVPEFLPAGCCLSRETDNPDPEIIRWELISDSFARADGFADQHDLCQFWYDTHGPGRFDGVIIKWKHTTNPPN